MSGSKSGYAPGPPNSVDLPNDWEEFSHTDAAKPWAYSLDIIKKNGLQQAYNGDYVSGSNSVGQTYKAYQDWIASKAAARGLENDYANFTNEQPGREATILTGKPIQRPLLWG